MAVVVNFRIVFMPPVIPAQAGIQWANEIVNSFENNFNNTVLPAVKLINKQTITHLRAFLDSRDSGHTPCAGMTMGVLCGIKMNL